MCSNQPAAEEVAKAAEAVVDAVVDKALVASVELVVDAVVQVLVVPACEAVLVGAEARV